MNYPPKIFLISNMYPTSTMPGFGVFVKNVEVGLCKYGATIKYRALIEGKGRSLLQKFRKYSLFYLTILAYFFRGYDVIYLHYPNMALPILFFLFKIKKKKLVVNLHGEDLFYSGKWGTKLGRVTEKFLSRYATKIVVPSVFFQKELLRRHICSSEKIFVSPSGGIDSKLFYPIPSFEETKFCLGYVGRIDKDKGWYEYVEVLHLLKGKIDFKGIIVGYGQQEKELDALLEVYGLKDKVTVIPGVSQSDLCYYYNQFNLLLFTTQLPESLGLVGLEAMACGIPVVGTNIGGITSYLIDRYNGYLCAVHNIQDIFNAVVEYTKLSVEARRIMKQNCLKTAGEYYSDKVLCDLAQMFFHL